MPRGSSSRSKPAPAPARSAPPPAARTPPPPAPAARAPAPAPAPASAPSSGGGMLSGLGATMAQGFAFGTGSALAREAVGSVMGAFSSKDEKAAPAAPAQTQQQYTAPATGGACEYDRQAFMSCLQNNQNNASNCDHYFNALQACQSRS